MSEESVNREQDIQEDMRDAADNTESGLDQTGDKIKAGTKAMGNKVKDPDNDVNAEYDKEKLKEEAKDY